jgi:hypothetical protein
LLKVVSNGYVTGILGVVFAHVIAATFDPELKSAAFGIVIGGLLALIAVPIMEKYVIKSKYHIVAGDHEDIKKDLKDHHH